MKIVVNDQVHLSEVRASDTSAIVEHLNDRDVYERTLRIPFPYTENDAEEWLGRVANSVLEPIVVSGAITGGTVGIVRAGSAAVRRLQTGFVRYYAAALVVGLSGIALYFLISSS